MAQGATTRRVDLSVLTLRLADRLRSALEAAPRDGLGSAQFGLLADAVPIDRRDRVISLSLLYELETAPLPRIGEAARLARHPVLAQLKWRLEEDWMRDLDALDDEDRLGSSLDTDDVVGSMRALAASDRLPGVYRWIAKEATWEEVVRFLALEGGPDAGFDDLVAICQLGLSGDAKLELARNYWDEMGNGDLHAVHTSLHDQLVAAVSIPRLAEQEQPTCGLERSALGGLLATNRWLQPEMLGALGLTELQAGPRCRLVLQAFDRCGAPADAYPFYEVHAQVDPRHGKDWLDNAIAPLTSEHPQWSARILRGALWRYRLNAAFFADVRHHLGGHDESLRECSDVGAARQATAAPTDIAV